MLFIIMRTIRNVLNAHVTCTNRYVACFQNEKPLQYVSQSKSSKLPVRLYYLFRVHKVGISLTHLLIFLSSSLGIATGFLFLSLLSFLLQFGSFDLDQKS